MLIKRFATAATVLVVMLVASTHASATELDQYDSKLGKTAGKILCMCTGEGLANHIGYLQTSQDNPSPGYVRHKVHCKISGFTSADGVYQGANLCSAFLVLN